VRLFGLIGYPLSHSFSARHFSEKFEKESISDCLYREFPLTSVEEFLTLIKANPNLHGLNVTIPYKVSILPYLDAIDEKAAAIGAVNCIHIFNGKTTGYNTDALGFEYSIRPFLENKYERALVLGNGGAAKAIVHVLNNWGIDYRIVTRNPQNNNELNYTDLDAESIPFFPLIINTTPLGMFPNIHELPPIPYEVISTRHFLYDVIYNPEITAFLQKGKDAGAQIMNGLSMLQLQAEKSWEIWNKEM